MKNNQDKYYIQPEFEKKLKQLRVKTRFIKNLKNPKWICPENTNIYEEKRKNANNFENFIAYSFRWEATPEDHDFWENISFK